MLNTEPPVTGMLFTPVIWTSAQISEVSVPIVLPPTLKTMVSSASASAGSPDPTVLDAPASKIELPS